MPSGAQPDTHLRRLVLAFAVVAAALWLIACIPLLSGHASTLFPGGRNFEDILVYQGRFTVFHTAKFFTSKRFSGFAYPAGCAPIYAAFYAIPDPIRTYLLLSTVVAVAAIGVTLFHLRRANVTNLFVPLLLLSFPFVFLVQRANIEIILFALVAMGILAYMRGLPYVAAVLFSLAAACKLYPIFLLGLFLRRKPNVPAFLTGIAAALLTMCASIAYTGPTFMIAAQGFFTGVNRFQGHYVDTVSTVEVAFDHCLFSPLKYLAFTQHSSPATWRLPYYLIAGTLALLLFLRVRTLPFLNVLVFLTAAMIGLPPVSFNYTLVHLYLPALLLLAALARASAPATAHLSLAVLFFLFLPLIGLASFAPTIPAGPIQSCAVLALFLLPALTAWPTTIAGDAA